MNNHRQIENKVVCTKGWWSLVGGWFHVKTSIRMLFCFVLLQSVYSLSLSLSLSTFPMI